MNSALNSSKRMDWRTPKALLNALVNEFGSMWDPCREPFVDGSLVRNALAEEWEFPAYVNPPYGRAIAAWMAKCAEQGERGVVVALVPARTDTSWWHESVIGRAAEVRLIRGRLRFDDQDGRAPFPSALVVYRPGNTETRFLAADTLGRAA